MITVTVLYSNLAEARFDHDYYRGIHMPMVHRLWDPMGMTGAQVLRGVVGPDGSAPPFLVMTTMTWPDLAAFTRAARAHAAELMGDVPNFTNIPAQMQVSEA